MRLRLELRPLQQGEALLQRLFEKGAHLLPCVEGVHEGVGVAHEASRGHLLPKAGEA